MAKILLRQAATLRYARRYSILATLNHVPDVALVAWNTRTMFVAVPRLSGSEHRYTAPPAWHVHQSLFQRLYGRPRSMSIYGNEHYTTVSFSQSQHL